MKKMLISLVLASVLSVCAFAVTPAVNVLTGTKDALSFENVSGADCFTYGNQEYIKYMTYKIADDPTGSGRGKVFEAKADLSAITADKGSDTYIYYQLIKDYIGTLDRPVYLYYETYGNGQIGFWLNAENKHVGTTVGSWQTIASNNGGIIPASTTQLKIQYATKGSGCSESQCFDNMAAYSYYKIDYVTTYPNGTDGVTTTKYYFDATNLKIAKDGTATGFPTSYAVENMSAAFSGYNHLGWSTVKGATVPMTSVSLSGKDVTLYPVWEKKAVLNKVDVTIYLDEAKQNKITDEVDEGFSVKLPTYAELAAYTPSGKIPSGFRMNGVLYAPGKTVIIPEADSVVFTAEYKSLLHEEYGKLVAYESFDAIANGTYIMDASTGSSNPINLSYINPSWSKKADHFKLRYGDSMSNSLQVAEVPDFGNVLKVTKAKAASMWPQMYLFNDGGTPDGLYTVTADFILPNSEVANITSMTVRVYYGGKESKNAQATVNAPGNGGKIVTVGYTIPVYAGSDITSMPKIQIYATTDTAKDNTFYYVDNISVYYKDAHVAVKLSDTKTQKIFFTPGEEITLPYSYEILDVIPDGHVLVGFEYNGKMYSEGEKYTTKETDSVLDFEAVYEKRAYALKFETGKANGTIGEIKILDGETEALPADGLYNPSLNLAGWKIKGTDMEFAKGAAFTFDAETMQKHLDGTDRLVFEPVFSGADFTAYGFENDVTVPSGTPAFSTLLGVADSLYYGVRGKASPSLTDAERLSDMVSKGICPEYADLTKRATFGDAAVVLANALPEKFYRELCFDVDINGSAEALKLVRAGIFNESTYFEAEISYTDLCTAVEKLTDFTKRSVENKRTFFVLGDSLTEAYGPSKSMKGWPEFSENYFTGNIAVVNYGISGLNTGSYHNPSHERAPGYYNSMITSVRPGDYVIIALGTNDSTLWGRGDMTKEQSLANYNRLITEIRAQGGIPMLVCPVGRNSTDENGNYIESDPDIITVMQSVNETYGVNVPIINFKSVSFDRLSAMTAAERGEFYIDTVHYKAKGADMVAGWFEELVLASEDVQLEGLKYHCINYTDEEPSEHITIDIGEKTSASNVRFAQINGVRVAVEDGKNEIDIAVGTSNFVVEIIEKKSSDDAACVKTSCYYVDAEQLSYTKLALDDYAKAEDVTEIRVKHPAGIRFKAQFNNGVKWQSADAVVEEYGFIISRSDLLEKASAELTFDFETAVSGAAYNRQEGTDIVFDSSDGEVTVFAGVLTNIPEKHYETKLVCRTYTRVSVDGEIFVLYGEPVKASMYEIAKAVLSKDNVAENVREFLSAIVCKVEDKDVMIDISEFYK